MNGDSISKAIYEEALGQCEKDLWVLESQLKDREAGASWSVGAGTDDGAVKYEALDQREKALRNKEQELLGREKRLGALNGDDSELEKRFNNIIDSEKELSLLHSDLMQKGNQHEKAAGEQKRQILAKDNEIVSVAKELEKLKQESNNQNLNDLNALKNEVETKRNYIWLLENKLKQQESDIQELQAKISELKAEREQLIAVKQELKNMVQELISKAAKEAEASTLRKELQAKDEVVRYIQCKLKGQEIDSEELRANANELSTLRDMNLVPYEDSVAKELEKLKQESNNQILNDLNALKNEVETKRNYIWSLENKVKQQEGDIQELQAKISELKAEREQLIAVKQELKNIELIELISKAAKEAEASTLRKELQAKDEVVRSLQSKLNGQEIDSEELRTNMLDYLLWVIQETMEANCRVADEKARLNRKLSYIAFVVSVLANLYWIFSRSQN